MNHFPFKPQSVSTTAMKFGVIFLFALASYCAVYCLVQALKCQTDEGITEEDARKLMKKCIRRTRNDFDGRNACRNE